MDRSCIPSLPRAIALLMLALGLAAGQPAQAADQRGLIKAAFIYNFARFTDWPADSFAEDSASVRVCYWKGDPLGSALATIEGKQVGPHSIEVVDLDGPAEPPPSCHVAVLSASEVAAGRLAVRGLLTIGDIADLGQGGVAVGLIQIGRQIRFQINATAIAGADLRMSSKLLRLAAKVVQ